MAKAKEQVIASNDAVKLEEGQNTISGPIPGSSIKNAEMTFEDLGDLMTFEPASSKEDEEGSGEYVTILCDYLSGSGGKPLFKGSVVRLSNCVNDYAADDATRGAVLRLMNLEAIRKSTRQEIEAGSATITAMSESPEVRAERDRANRAEAQLEEYRRQMEGGGKLTTENDVPVPVEDKTAKKGGEEDALSDDAAWQ